MTEPSYEELKAKIAELEAKQQRRSALTFKVSDKGGVSVYGLGRFAVSLYYEQWIRLLDNAQKLRWFLDANKDDLKLSSEPKTKGDSRKFISTMVDGERRTVPFEPPPAHREPPLVQGGLPGLGKRR